MKKEFATTMNVRRFIDAMNRLETRDSGVPGMGLMFGEPGLGKTRTALWWTVQNGGVFIRTKAAMSVHWLLEEVISELGEAPMHRTADLFRQVESQLIENPRTVIIDEVDRLGIDVLETIRDVADVTEAPIVCVGMQGADKRLMRHRHLYDRFSEIVKFTELTLADVTALAEQLCEVPIGEDAAQFIYARATRFRRIVLWFYRAEAQAKRNGLSFITAADLKEFDR